MMVVVLTRPFTGVDILVRPSQTWLVVVMDVHALLLKLAEVEYMKGWHRGAAGLPMYGKQSDSWAQGFKAGGEALDAAKKEATALFQARHASSAQPEQPESDVE